ncbi:deoxyribodipyrimidine photo-lyase [Mycoplasmatota bacterium]|nr:deoxyribodipyrimidine photo-lyase [Mycoplasmatota bacterium]
MQHILWFKKDLRVFDHQPLFTASKEASILPIYILEPSIWNYGDLSNRHLKFVMESLIDLQDAFKQKGADLFVTVGEMEDVFEHLFKTYGRFKLYSHREHGLKHTYDRDIRVKKWISDHHCEWLEFPSFAVARYSSEHPRKNFKEELLKQKIYPAPKKICLPEVISSILSNQLKDIEHFHIQGDLPLNGLHGGEKEAILKANAFFKSRYKKYNVYINKPYYSIQSSSLLSPYLTWGNISIKALQISTKRHLLELEQSNEFNHSQLKAFHQRIQWHCSFVQAVENDPLLHINSRDIRFEGMRIHDYEKLEAFRTGKTGIPFIDACMIALNQTGWINFKQRATVASFACNTLLLDWRDVGYVLANLWFDYEPGIHWLQMQTQAGLIPHSHIPLYDVIKQSKMHDPDGLFIKKYIPQLSTAPIHLIHEPWLIENNPYISPIISYREMFNMTKERLYKIKSSK